MPPTIEEKILLLKDRFAECKTQEKRYELLIELGKGLQAYPEGRRTEEHLVKGCQSELFLWAEKVENKIFFYAASEALISAGLVALLIQVYSGQTPETILKTPPRFLEELGLFQSLSPSRSNGLSQAYKSLIKKTIKSFSDSNSG